MQVIYSKISLFDAQHPVLIYDEETKEGYDLGKVSAVELPAFIKEQCYQNNIYKVHLFGVTEFVESVEQRIMEIEMRNYGEAKIQVEVNK